MLITGLDTETTGLSQSNGHRLVEVAMKVYHWPSRTVRLEFEQRINPQRTIDPKAQEVHGISIADLAGKPTIEKVAPRIMKILEKTDLLVAHNGVGFDFPFLYGELMRLGHEPPNVEGFDTMLEGRWACASGKVPSLGELCWACDVDYDPTAAHAAMYDVDVMMESFFKAFDLGFFKPDVLLSETAEAA